jgi:glycosyltransferase involved in cell wall biosynthesis
MNYFWAHDIWADQNSLRNVHSDKIDKYFCLSPWHKEFFAQHHKVPLEKIWVTKNGIDLSRFNKEVVRENRLIYSSSPDRGLDTLLYLFPFIKSVIPDLTLHVFYGFDNWDKSIQTQGSDEQKRLRDQIFKDLKQDGVISHGRVSQSQLAEEIMKSKIWAYPTRFWETFCISALEMMAGGVTIVTSNLAGLKTTVGQNGVLIDGDAYTKEYRVQFVDEVVELFENEEKWKRYSDRGKEYVKSFDWRNVAREWDNFFKGDV